MTSRDSPVEVPPHPFLFLVLNLPYGASAGFVSVTLAYMLSSEGVSTEKIAAIVALSLFPLSWQFLWAPIVDTTLGRKTWYLIGVALTAAGVAASGIVQSNRDGLALLSAFVFLTSVGATLLAMSIQSLIAHHTADHRRGRASGWYQAGNLGGTGLGGGAALWIAEHMSPSWIAAVGLGGSFMVCALALAWIPRTAVPSRPISGDVSLAGLVREQYSRVVLVLKTLWSLARSRRGYLGLLIVFLPIGTGAASNLWAAVADGWHASGDTVALVNGALGGVASLIGCLVGGYFCDRLDRKNAYIFFGVLQALCAVAMGLAPQTQSMFIVFTLAYAILTGMAYASYSAIALEAVGLNAAATQYNAYASLANLPVLYMGLVDGWAYTRFGPSGMLYVEALIAMAAIVVFFAASTVTKGLPSRPVKSAPAG